MDDEKVLVNFTEKLVVGSAMIEGNSEESAAVSLHQLSEMAKGFANDNICSQGAAGIHVCLTHLKTLDMGKFGEEILKKIGRKLENCLADMTILQEMYSKSKCMCDIYSDMKKIEQSFENLCYYLVEAFNRYKIDISEKVTVDNVKKVYKEKQINVDNLVEILKWTDAGFERIIEQIKEAKNNVEIQKTYVREEYITISGKIYRMFSTMLKGLWTYKYSFYFTGLCLYNIYNVVYLPGDMGITMNTLFRVLTAMCFTFANDIVKLNQMRRLFIDTIGSFVLKICGFFLGLFVFNIDFPRVKQFLSFFIHLLCIGVTNWIQTIANSICAMFGTSYALYEVGGLSEAFWNGVNEFGVQLTKWAVNTVEFLEGIFEEFGNNLINLIKMLLPSKTFFENIWQTLIETPTEYLRNLFKPTNVDWSQVGGEVMTFENLRDSTGDLAFTSPSGNLVVIDDELREKVVGLVNNVFETFSKDVSPREIGKNLGNIQSLVLDSQFGSSDQQQFALKMMKIAAAESVKNTIKETIKSQTKNTFEKVQGVVEKALEKSKMKPIIDWGTSQGPFKQTMIITFFFLSCFAFLFSFIFNKKNSPFFGYFLDTLE